MTLTINHLVGGYSQVPVIKDVNFEVADQELVALIGLNGAGKSTTINHIIGLLTPQHGDVSIDGTSLMANPALYKQKIAYVPEQPVLYDELTLKEHLELTIMAYQLDDATAWNRANELLKIFRLDNKLTWFPANFSKGMKQKVMLVNAFMTNADVFIIDEPFIGLDPLAVHDLLGLIAEVKARGAAVLMSTHVLDTAEKIADRFVLLHNGEIRADGTLAYLRDQFPEAGSSLNDIYLTLAKEV
ncbi:ABC transporter ATP-binding protein [Periweissella fabalis]|uniref:ABC transporter ATP-binding protein n=1 Tax=Periweissella fabalis TaxID=1070421 RepID=A0A7X6N3U7_9LACO|nr:ABC transporter ATP-binding protein [Periweissella fabalis]MCM0598614.1 ABC transporter ATP-binding protein [Periweissella fabalis]NKZ24267.1 ABC transporter ATP-binding protein [Periweissella fabalis]